LQIRPNKSDWKVFVLDPNYLGRQRVSESSFSSRLPVVLIMTITTCVTIRFEKHKQITSDRRKEGG
jgi:hypothetical protein